MNAINVKDNTINIMNAVAILYKYQSVMNYNLYYVKLFSLVVNGKSMIIKTNYYLFSHSFLFG